MRATARALMAALAVAAAAAPAAAQQILLDRPVRAAELVVFPDLNDELSYYYVVDKPRLAASADGKPQFSFLRYVENVRSGAEDPEAREGEGGGIVHALVSLSVTPQQIRDAQRELQRVRSSAKLVGPVVFRSGKFGLVTSFRDPSGKLSTQVVGLGNAPLLDGEKAAVSMQLTKLGAKVLWESFQTAAPDISFSFEMDLEGYRSPQRGVIEADFDQIYEHQSFGAGLATPYLAAEIRAAFEDLTRKGAIKVTQVGEDAKINELLTTAYNKIADMMFSPLNGTGTPSLSSLAGAGGQPGLLDRASTMLQRGREEARQDNERIRAENRAAEERARETRRTGEGSGQGGAGQPAAGQGGRTGQGSGSGQGGGSGEGGDAQGAAAEGGGPRPYAASQPNLGAEHAERARPTDAPTAGTPSRQEEVSPPSFAIVAAFEMKRVRQRGTFRVDLNKFTADRLTLRFDENIGDLRNLMGDAAHFRQVNLDDPLYRQRELVAFLDGFNATDFGQYINFVNVRMRKKHQSGEETNDEVRIDRNNFTAQGNSFKLLYGWKGDSDRRRWMDYEVQSVWNFFGGQTVEEPWKRLSTGTIPVSPPFERRVVELEADPDAIREADVRSITAKLFYKLGDAEQVRQVTLNPAKDQLSSKVEFMLPKGQYDYDYEITWRLRGNRTVSSGRQTASDATLFVDELPAQ